MSDEQEKSDAQMINEDIDFFDRMMQITEREEKIGDGLGVVIFFVWLFVAAIGFTIYSIWFRR